MDLLDLISLFYAFIGLRALYNAIRNWRALSDANLTANDRRLADQLAFFVLIPPGVFLHEVGHEIATWQLGGTIAEFHFAFFYGYVVPVGHFTALGDWWIALSGNLVSVAYGLLAIPFIWLARASWQKYLLYSFARIQLLNALIFYPLITLAGFEGDWRTIYDLRILLQGIPVGVLFGIFHAALLLALWLIFRSLRVRRWELSLYAGVAARLDALDAAVAANPHNAEAYINRANLFAEARESNLARADYQRALKLDASNPRALYDLGQIEFSKKNLRAAEQNFRAALARTLGDATLAAYTHYGLGRVMVERGLRDLAVREFDQAITFDANFADAYYWRGMAQRVLGQSVRARADFEKAAELTSVSNPAFAAQAREMIRVTQ